MKKETYAYPSTMARMKAEYKIFILAFVFIVIADSIGQIQVPLGPGTLILFPIFYSLIMGVISGPEVLKIFNKKEVKAASKLVIVAICPFIAKLGINAGASLEVILSAGPALVLQEIGNLGTIFLALPFALLLGLKREAIGATHSINRESNLALITDMFGPDSPETRGSLSIYVVGGMVGTIYFGFMTTMVAALHIFHPYALGMASGVGAGILMASATASPLCPAREFVIASANSINFTAPLTLVGAYAGISIGDQIKSFVKQGWKMIIVGVLVMTGTFLGSACIAQLVLSLTNAI